MINDNGLLEDVPGPATALTPNVGPVNEGRLALLKCTCPGD